MEMGAMETEAPPLKRDAMGRFAPGGSGRPFGARNKVSRRLAHAILADFEANKDEVLPRLRRWFLPQYVSLIGRLMQRGGEAEAPENAAAVSAEEAAALLEAARLAFARIEAGEGTLADLVAALAGEAPAGEGESAAAEGQGADIIGEYR